MTTIPDKPCYRIDEVADLLQVSRRTVWNWIQLGRIQAVLHLGPRTHRIPIEELRRLVATMADDSRHDRRRETVGRR